MTTNYTFTKLQIFPRITIIQFNRFYYQINIMTTCQWSHILLIFLYLVSSSEINRAISKNIEPMLPIVLEI